jgi:hypothetical protein
MLRSVRYSFMMSGEATKAECTSRGPDQQLVPSCHAAKVGRPRRRSRSEEVPAPLTGIFALRLAAPPYIVRRVVRFQLLIQFTMDEWFIGLPPTDNLDKSDSGVTTSASGTVADSWSLFVPISLYVASLVTSHQFSP